MDSEDMKLRLLMQRSLRVFSYGLIALLIVLVVETGAAAYPTATDVNIQGSMWRWVPEQIVPVSGIGYSDYYPEYSVDADTGTFMMDTPFNSVSYIERYFDLPSNGSSLSLTVWGARNINGWCGDPVTVTASVIDSSNNTHQLGSFVPVQLDGGVGPGETKKFSVSNFAGQKVKIRIKQTSNGEHCTFGYYRDITIQTSQIIPTATDVNIQGSMWRWVPEQIVPVSGIGYSDYYPEYHLDADTGTFMMDTPFNSVSYIERYFDLPSDGSSLSLTVWGARNINGWCGDPVTVTVSVIDSGNITHQLGSFVPVQLDGGVGQGETKKFSVSNFAGQKVKIRIKQTSSGEHCTYGYFRNITIQTFPTSEFEFIHLTDVHIGYELQSIERFADALKAINDLNPKPAFILITGDLVEWNADNFFKAFNGILESNAIQVFFIPGNHDRRTYSLGGDDNLVNYHRYINPSGEDNYTFDYEGYRFIGLDSGKDYDPVYKADFSPEGCGLTCDQLLDLIDLGKKDSKIIFMHHPAINDRNDSSGTGLNPIEDGAIGGNDACIASYRHRFISYCKNYNVQLVLTGHTHADKCFDADGGYTMQRPLFIQTRSATKDIDVCGVSIYKHGFRRIKVTSDRATPYPSTATRSYPNKGAIIYGLVNLHAYDSQGRHTGVIDYDDERNIPASYYTGNYGCTIDPYTPQMIILYNANEDYRFVTTPHTLSSTATSEQKNLQTTTSETESFNLTIINQTDEALIAISYYNVPITDNTTTTTYLNKTATDYTMFIDYNGDNVTDETKDPDSIEMNYAPTATVISPKNGSVYNKSEPIEFSGTGTDPEDGVLANLSLVWTSNIDGMVGVGNTFSNANLSVGIHTVTLMVNDNGRLTDAHNITLTVNEIAGPNRIYVDFFVTGDSNGNVYVFPSYDNGSFADKELVGNIGSNCLGSAIADFDNDGDLDFTIQSNGGHSDLFINNGTGGFAQTKIAEGLSLSKHSSESTTADFNNDGYYDYVVSSSGAYIYLFTNNGDKTFSKSTISAEWLVTGRGLNFLAGIDTDDFNEDGNMDFLIAEYREYGTDLVYLYIGKGDGTFTYKFAFDNTDYEGGDTRAVVAGDLDNDGYCDAIVGQDDDGEPGQTWLYKGDGTGKFTYSGKAYDTNPSRESGNEYSGAGYADAYDFDGDGNLDVVASAHPYGGGDSGTFFIKGNGDGSFRTPTKVDEYIGPGISAPPLEVKPRLLVFDTGEGTYPSIRGMHNGTITPSQPISVQKLYTYPCTGTGGHTKHARIWNSSLDTNATWNGYTGDGHNITFLEPFMLVPNETYNYTIITGSYPQIIPKSSKEVAGGLITCTNFTDANGKQYDDRILAIRLWSG